MATKRDWLPTGRSGQLEMGKAAYFSIRYENSKGKAGPWGPLASALIP